MSSSIVGTARRLVVGGIATAGLALPLALTSLPAQAATLNGCTVVPQTPVVVGLVGGQPNVRFRTAVTCAKDRIVQVVDQRLEADAPAGIAGDQSYGSTTYLRTFATAGTVFLTTYDVATSTENSNEEVYHRTSFKVATINGVSGPTAFQSSPVRSVAN